MSKKLAEEIDNLELKNFKYWSSYYAKEAEKLQQFFKLFGFDKNDLLLSKNCNKSFNVLVSIAQQLKLDNINEISYTTSLRELLLKKFKLENAIFDCTIETGKTNEKLLKLNLFQETLMKDLKCLNYQIPSEKQSLQDIELSLQFMQGKIEKYKSQLEEMKSYNSKIDKSVSHEIIVSDFQNMKMLQKQLQEAKSKMDTYQDLPPNMAMAKIKIQSLKNEIEKMDQEIERMMSYIN